MNDESEGPYSRNIACVGDYVVIGRPTPQEFLLITELRNRPDVRGWFVDSRLLEEEENSRWLERQAPGIEGALYSIRFVQGGTFLGTVGWSWIDLATRKGDFGRFAIDKEVTERLRQSIPSDFPGFAYDAGKAFLRFIFLDLGMEEAYTETLVDNVRALRFQEKLGLTICGFEKRTRPDGSKIVMKKMCITRERWLSSRESRAGKTIATEESQIAAQGTR